ncbi:MAG: sensor histidine kinase [Chloroflexota bacterium]
MKEDQVNAKRNLWEQWDWVWHLCGYAALGISVILTLNSETTQYALPLYLLLSALVALWYIPFIATPMIGWWETPGRGLFYFLIGFLLWGGLVILNPNAFLLVTMFNPMIFTRFPIRWAIGVIIAATVGFLLLFIFFYSPENWLVLVPRFLGFLFVAILIGYFISALINQNIERQRLLDELTQAQASLLKAEREAGILAERQRMARDIHDTLAQQFTSIIMHASAARLGDSDAVPTHVQEVELAAREGLENTRRIIWDMRPEQLDQASLVVSIDKVAARWSAENKVRVETIVTGTPHTLTESIETALLRITQEALHNIKKHARAQLVNITLSYMPDRLALDVADNGSGFDVSKKTRGFGLSTMRSRAEEFDGTFSIESELGVGTTVAVSLPIGEK